MEEKKEYTREEIIEIAKHLIGKTFGELTEKKDYDKGTYGHIIEQDVFRYAINSKSSPDFEKAGIELKVTPYKKNKDGSFSAKERLVLNIINYMDEYKNTFSESHFWYKNHEIQIIWYLYDDRKPKKEYRITHEMLYTFPEKDLPIIMNDWNIIIDKIKQGKAHEISEADTMYLGACTKGVNSSSVRQQPFSHILAKQRAFCFKTSYMTQLVREHISGDKLESIVESSKPESNFEKYVKDKLNVYSGKTIDDLKNMFNVHSDAKSINNILLSKMFGIEGSLSKADELVKANIIPKTIRVNKNGSIKESMSFPAFKYTEIIQEKWDTCPLNEYFSTTKFLFVVFKEGPSGFYFSHVKFWNMPYEILNNEVKKVWEQTVKVISDGNIVKEVKNDKRYTNFPGMASNDYCHVRPHGQNADDAYPLPVRDKLTGLTSYTKHCFWLNSSYIIKIINN